MTPPLAPMLAGRERRAWIAAVLALLLAPRPGHALVTLNDGHDRIFVSATVGVSHDSNVFAAAGSAGDFVYSSSLSADYTRRAGWIGVNASAAVSSSRFAEIEGQDFTHPAFSLELDKKSGRTTGALSMHAARESRADAAVNVRATSWNQGAALALRYPVTPTFTLSTNLGYDRSEYVDSSLFSDLATHTAALDLFHIFTADRDLVGGYRYRYGDTSRSTAFADHSFTAGVNGRLIRGVNGSLRAGHQVRIPHGLAPDDERFSSWTVAGSATYPVNKRLGVTGRVAKDFTTTALEAFVDSVTGAVEAQYDFSSRWTMAAGASWGDSRFLGEGGRVTLPSESSASLGAPRRDTHAGWTTSLTFAPNEHLRLTASHAWFQNWSTSAYADFVRATWSITAHTRW